MQDLQAPTSAQPCIFNWDTEWNVPKYAKNPNIFLNYRNKSKLYIYEPTVSRQESLCFKLWLRFLLARLDMITNAEFSELTFSAQGRAFQIGD